MFRQFIDKIRRYYRTVVLPSSIFEDSNVLTIEDKRFFVSSILAKPESRRIIEKYIRWKVGVKTRAAMRSEDDRETLKFKEQAYSLGEQTIDFQNFWNEVHRADEKVVEEEKAENEEKARFKLFPGSDSEHQE